MRPGAHRSACAQLLARHLSCSPSQMRSPRMQGTCGARRWRALLCPWPCPTDDVSRPTARVAHRSARPAHAVVAPPPRSRRGARAAGQHARRQHRRRFRGVTKRYDSGDTGLERATFAIDRQEFVFLVGATGSGKSTIMRLLIKELEPTEGIIRRRRPPPGRDRAQAASPTTGATSASSSRTSSCCPRAPSTTTSPTRCRSPAPRASRSAPRCPTSCASPVSPPSCTTIPTSSPAASSSASP